MVNMDSLGTTLTKVETYHADPRLLRALGSVAQSVNLPLAVVNVHNVGLSDNDSFDQKKIPIVDLHSITEDTFPILHPKRDQLKAIDLAAYYDSYKLIALYLAYLDITLDAAENPN